MSSDDSPHVGDRVSADPPPSRNQARAEPMPVDGEQSAPGTGNLSSAHPQAPAAPALSATNEPPQWLPEGGPRPGGGAPDPAASPSAQGVANPVPGGASTGTAGSGPGRSAVAPRPAAPDGEVAPT